jgi:hypothetical protein
MAFAASRLLAWLSLICSAVEGELSDLTARVVIMSVIPFGAIW